MSRFWSKNVKNLTPYTPGEQPQVAKLDKLNTNENPYGPSPKVIIIATRERVTLAMQTLGFDVLPSSANFVLAKHAHKAAAEIFEALRGRGIIVRYFNKPRINEYVRISIGTDAEMDALFAALREIVAE